MSVKQQAVNRWPARILAVGILCSAVAIVPLFAAQDDFHREHRAPAVLVHKVRDVTREFLDVNNAGPAGYQPAFGCVSGPDHGAMGIHYVNMDLVKDGELAVGAPEALIYEPIGEKRRLVGVEYIVDADTWLKAHKGQPPVLEGQDFNLVGVPNRFNIPAPFFELHVWAWRDNPQGSFVDWNNNVTCDHAEGDL